ncbi:hypothetical protein [Burkholderia sp. Ac-20379]|uniref:hypothetical protein n=1 Tax=Burkholderia sp. Ac-20379 TaxID=2703900 RepID=UPI00197F416A|nr:hypothetical protein [Burkholderia sp. Ac-20379]MBN3724875.1 hypothetical protein [Burkholderia sp. Ac-20379]
MTDRFANRKRAIALLLFLSLLLAAATAYLLRPRYTPAERDYYTALFCHAMTTGSRDPDKTMRAIVENGNADYALSKIEYNAPAARDAMSRFAKLDAAQQRTAAQDSADCERLLGLAGR